MFRRQELFDFSGYSRDSQYYNTENMKKISKIKDEMGRVPIAEFVGRAKLYQVLAGNSKEMKKAKGVNKTVVKHEIKHSNYLDCLKNEAIYTDQMKAYTHQNIKSLVQKKIRNRWHPMAINDIL